MQLPALPRPQERLQLATPHGSADALLLAHYATQAQPLVILAASAQTALRLKEELAFFLPQKTIVLLPDWETLPYDHFSPHHDLISERLASLWQIRNNEAQVVIVPVQTAMGVLPPVEYLTAYSFFLKKGQKFDADKLRADLAFAGYSNVTQVYGPGEFSIRGGLIDLFPMGSPLPYRIDLFGDEIETIRTFDVDTQRSLYPVPEIRLLPAREFPLDDGGRSKFRQRFREEFEGDPSKSRLYKDISAGSTPAGIEYYLPLFFDHTATLFDYLPKEAVLTLHGEILPAAEQFWRDVESRHRLLAGEKDRPLLPPASLFLAPDRFMGALKDYRRIELTAPEIPPAPPLAKGGTPLSIPLPSLAVDRRAENPLKKLQDFLAGHAGRTLICAESLGRRETMAQYFAEYSLKPALAESWEDALTRSDPVLLIAAPLFNGFIRTEDGLALITEADLYPSVAQSRGKKQQKRSNTDAMLRDLSELKIGDPVVHEAHGIGRYQGLISMDLGEGETELLVLEYAGDDKLYVPVSQLHVISRYSGGAMDTAPLHKLGSGTWEKAKRKAAEQVRDTAAELLNLYARRAARQGHAFDWSLHDYDAFAEGFGFEETADQAAAIEAVLVDMRIGKPMDRLVCGDVGFGKTEVALRAAFAAVTGGKQVAVLVPTTLLAEQHFQTFSDRFADWPVKIVELSRFRSQKETTAALKGIADGSVDIVIGTHKLVQPDVQFKQLGLVIIDEEHRFGVRQKEQLKALRADVDVLTLTATPIPRTLAMSLEGLRDFSVIATAPSKRLAVKTFVAKYGDGVIREAVLRELKRGGQVFFLHNEVDTIENMREKLTALLPEARIGMAHGQMKERELEHVMRDFYQQRFNILLCTTIIETGIDVPNANTILMNRADKFGLAQLHQMRGRVGRSHHQAYCYLLVNEPEALTAGAKKRLEAIQAMEELGSGFYLAMHDLEIRGAGEVLGDSQSGEMQEIGFALYSQMLNEAVKAMKAGKEPDLTQPLGVTTEINLHAPALLPNDYSPDVHERLSLYKRLANCETGEDLDDLMQELIDRFGLLPDAARTLLDCHRLRMLAKPLGIQKIDAADSAIVITFGAKTPVDPMRIIGLIQSKKNYKLAGQDRLRIEGNWPEASLRAVRVKEILGELKG
ncbi:transcription-repair coupling factor (superfamily II helicase) [Formivibrio citricus]|uniref:Transcription-repair-coupling factor n=1 Tax=Formivibrio citricus TaxID=83765 RepID=A0A1I4WAE3_9NEIS|nr:transcription-repair coupling factor [Formivibrio citricus]SFN10397.1 transcription-repair coupling factor (superfamily II helicase) [Formivibrio citricus]